MMMKGAKTWDEMLAEMPADLQERIHEGARKIVRENRLARIRETAMKTQSEVKGMTQDGVSRLENRKDWLVSSLNTYVRGMGGTLKIVAELPGVGTVELPVTSRGTLAKSPSGVKAPPRRRRVS
jgi:hypothetical protein